ATAATFTASGDHVDVTTGAPTWSYLSLETATRADALAPEPVPGRVAFDEARSQPVVAQLAGDVESVAARLGQRAAQGDDLVAVHSPALVDVYQELAPSRAEAGAGEETVAGPQSLV